MRQPDIATERSIHPYDVALGNLTGLPGGLETSPSTIQVLQPIVGRAETFTIKTIRHEIGKSKNDEPVFGFTQFLEITSAEGFVRIVIPPPVSDKLAAQREALTGRVRKRAARQAVQTRRDRGDVLGNVDALKKARKARKTKR